MFYVKHNMNHARKDGYEATVSRSGMVASYRDDKEH